MFLKISSLIISLTDYSKGSYNRKSNPLQPESGPHIDPVLPTLTFTFIHCCVHCLLSLSIEFLELSPNVNSILPTFTFTWAHCYVFNSKYLNVYFPFHLISFQPDVMQESFLTRINGRTLRANCLLWMSVPNSLSWDVTKAWFHLSSLCTSSTQAHKFANFQLSPLFLS